MPKLTKGEIAGIRLIADLFVINDLTKNVLSKHFSEDQIHGLKKNIVIAVPKFYLAESELQKQIKDVHEIWLKELSNDLQ